MSKMYLITAIVLSFLCSFSNGQLSERQQADLRALLAKAKSIRDALVVIESSDLEGRTGIGNRSMKAMILNETVNKKEQSIMSLAQDLNKNSTSIIEPRNGGCAPRIFCEEVQIDRITSSNIASFPQCVEVHRCGGCCQGAQFSCLPVEEVPVTFSPLLNVYLDGSKRVEVNGSLTLMNHTKCECKCRTTEAECHLQGKILSSKLCQCVEPRCSPKCRGQSTCSIVPGSYIPRCTCHDPIEGQSGNYCSNPKERPNADCTDCEPAYG